MLIVGCSQAWAENRKVTVYWESTTAVSTDYARVKVDDGSTTYDMDSNRPSSHLGPTTIDGTSYWYHEFNSIPTTKATTSSPLYINFCYGDDSNQSNLTWATNKDKTITSLPSNNVSLFYKYSDGQFSLAKIVDNSNYTINYYTVNGTPSISGSNVTSATGSKNTWNKGASASENTYTVTLTDGSYSFTAEPKSSNAYFAIDAAGAYYDGTSQPAFNDYTITYSSTTTGNCYLYVNDVQVATGSGNGVENTYTLTRLQSRTSGNASATVKVVDSDGYSKQIDNVTSNSIIKIEDFKVYFRYQDDSKECTAVDGSSNTISLSTTTDAKGYTWYYATFPYASSAAGTVTVSDVSGKNYTFNTNSEKWYVITGDNKATAYPSKEEAELAEASVLNVTIHYRAQINGEAKDASIATKDNNGNDVTATGTDSNTDAYGFTWKTASYNARTSSYSAHISADSYGTTIPSITSDSWIVLKGTGEYTAYASETEALAAEKKAVGKTITIYYRDGASISSPSGYLEVGKKSTDYDPEAMLVDEKGNEWHYQSFLIDKNKGMSFNSYTAQKSDVWLIGSTKYDTKAAALAAETDNSWYFVSPELTNSQCLPAFRLGNIINREDKGAYKYAINNDKFTFHMKDCDIKKFVEQAGKTYTSGMNIHYWIQNADGSIKYTAKGGGTSDDQIYQDLKNGAKYIFVKGIGDTDHIHVWKDGGSSETTWPGPTLSKSNTLTINGETGWYYYKTNGSSDNLQINNGSSSWNKEFSFSNSITLKFSSGEGTQANVTSYPEPSGSGSGIGATYELGSNKINITNSANGNYIYRSGESYAECKQSSSSTNAFVLKQLTAQSYTWTLNTGIAYGNDAQNGGTPITYQKESVTIEMNYQHGDLKSPEGANLAIPDDTDHKFYLIGNVDGTGFHAMDNYPMTRNVYYPNDDTTQDADSITYTLTLNAPKQGFGRMFAGVINSKMWQTYGSGVSGENAVKWYGSVIRPQVPMNRDAIALYGGLISNGNDLGTVVTYKQGSQALTPRVDESKVSSYIIHVNLTTATYWIELLESSDDMDSPVSSKQFYIAGPAVIDAPEVSDTDDYWTVYNSNGTRRTDNQHVMTYSPDDQCYIATVKMTYGLPFRFMIGDYSHNFGEDNVAPRTETAELALNASHIETCETNYFNMVNENSQTDVNTPKIGNNIMFNLPTGTYTVRFYTQMYKGTYGETPSFGGQYYYTIDYHIGMTAGADGVAARSIPGDDFVCYKNWSDHLAYVCPETIKMYYVTDFDAEAQSAVMAKFEPAEQYIPANTPLILGSNASIVKDKGYTYIIKPLDPYGLLLNDSEFEKVRVVEKDQTDNEEEDQTNNNVNKLLPVYHKTPVNAGDKDGDDYKVRNYGFGTLMPNGGSMKALRFWRIHTEGTNISAHKCYLAIPNTSGINLEYGLDPYTMPSTSPAKSITWIWANDIIEDNESDNIVTEVETPIFTAKTDDNAVYNMQGIRLNKRPTTPGLYIIGGKKVLVK